MCQSLWHMLNINSFAALHDAHDKPARTFYRLQHSVCNGHGRAYCILLHRHGKLLRIQAKTCEKPRCLLEEVWPPENRFLHSLCRVQCNAPLTLHLFRQGKRLRIPHKPSHNPKAFGLKIRACVLSDDVQVVDAHVPYFLIFRVNENLLDCT